MSVKLYNQLSVFKPYQMVNIHYEENGVKKTMCKSKDELWSDFRSRMTENKDNLGIFSLNVQWTVPNIDCIEVWLKPEGK